MEIAKANRTVRQYVEQVERENVVAESAQIVDPASVEAEGNSKLRRTYRNSPPKDSTTDPEAALSSKRGASDFAYYDNYLIDSRSCITGVMATPARLSWETVAARQMLGRATERFRLQPTSRPPTRAMAPVSFCPGSLIAR